MEGLRSISLLFGLSLIVCVFGLDSNEYSKETIHMYKLARDSYLFSFNNQYIYQINKEDYAIHSNQFPLPFLHLALNTNFSFYELHLVQGRWEEQIKQYFAGAIGESHKEKSFKSALSFQTYDSGLLFKASSDSDYNKIMSFASSFICTGIERLAKNILTLYDSNNHKIYYASDPMNYLCYDNLVHLFNTIKQPNLAKNTTHAISKSTFSNSPYSQIDIIEEKNSSHIWLNIRITFISTLDSILRDGLTIGPKLNSNMQPTELRLYMKNYNSYVSHLILSPEPLSKYTGLYAEEKPVIPYYEPLIVKRHLTGIDHEFHCKYIAIFRNVHSENIQVRFQEFLPRFLRPYFQTLEVIKNGVRLSQFKPKLITYSPKDDCYFDLGEFELNPKEELTISINVEKQILTFEEYPHDSSRGFDLPQMIFFYKTQGETIWRETYDGSIVTMIAQPDFSMPFNVHALNCVLVGIMLKLYLNFASDLP